MPRPITARIYRSTPKNLRFLAERLRAGELVGVPTETVYGLAANALDADACAKIFRAKGRPRTDPLIVHIDQVKALAETCRPNAAALKLARRFWPGPLTLVLPKTAVVPNIVSAGQPSVAVRMPSHPAFRKLLRLAGVPLAAPSANVFGYVSPTTAEHVRAGLGAKIRYILDGGAASIGLESTIVDLRDPEKPQLLRPGAITRRELERALGRRITVVRKSSAPTRVPQVAPGMLLRHYSPRTPVVLHAQLPAPSRPKEAYVFIRKPVGRPAKNVFWLDRHGNLRGAARRLFAMLRELDAADFSQLNVELARGEGLADAINDRLRRAAAR